VDLIALLASAIGAGYAACYLFACWIFPFGACRRCDGTGKLRNPIARRTFRLCPRCDGTGRRVRIGRRAIEYLRAEHRRGITGDPNRRKES